MKESAVADTIAALKAERVDITQAGDKLAASKQALSHLANRLRQSFQCIEEDKKLEAWLIEQKRDQEVARLALERSKLEIDITLRWFLSQLGTQQMRLEAKRELELPGAVRPVVELTHAQEHERAHLEVARAIVGSK